MGPLADKQPSVVIVSDGKPGHLHQSRGLARALAERVAGLTVTEVEAERVFAAHWQRDALVLAAGSRAYGPAFALKRKWKCPAIALMNPGVWRRWRFDLCVVPRHDGVSASRRVVVTEGALNTVGLDRERHGSGVSEVSSEAPAANAEGVMLVGGPSGHHGWHEDALLEQVQRVLTQSDLGARWSVTSSRRTPASTEAHLAAIAEAEGERVVFTPASQTPPGWVAEKLIAADQAWVTEDSVSMVYEALTAGCGVGLLAVPRQAGRPGRVVRGVAALVDRGWVTPIDAWSGGVLPAPPHRLDEARRVAGILLERLPWPTPL